MIPINENNNKIKTEFNMITIDKDNIKTITEFNMISKFSSFNNLLLKPTDGILHISGNYEFGWDDTFTHPFDKICLLLVLSKQFNNIQTYENILNVIKTKPSDNIILPWSDTNITCPHLVDSINFYEIITSLRDIQLYEWIMNRNTFVVIV